MPGDTLGPGVHVRILIASDELLADAHSYPRDETRSDSITRQASQEQNRQIAADPS